MKGSFAIHLDVEDLGLSVAAYRIHAYLCANANGKGECSRSYTEIIEATRIKSRSTVSKALKELIKKGLIEKKKGFDPVGGGLLTNNYIIIGLKKAIDEAKIKSKEENWILVENYYN